MSAAKDKRPAADRTKSEYIVIELLAELHTIANYLDDGQIVTARAMVLDLLKKHGGGE